MSATLKYRKHLRYEWLILRKCQNNLHAAHILPQTLSSLVLCLHLSLSSFPFPSSKILLVTTVYSGWACAGPGWEISRNRHLGDVVFIMLLWLVVLYQSKNKTGSNMIWENSLTIRSIELLFRNPITWSSSVHWVYIDAIADVQMKYIGMLRVWLLSHNFNIYSDISSVLVSIDSWG